MNQDGEAFLELKDQHGESSYKAAVASRSPPGLSRGRPPLPADGSNAASLQALLPAEAEAAPLAESGPVSAPPLRIMRYPGPDANGGGSLIAWNNSTRPASASEILLGPDTGRAGGDPQHPTAYDAFRPGDPRPGTGIPGGTPTPTATSGPPWALTAAVSGSTCGIPTATVAPLWAWGQKGLPVWRFMTETCGSGPELNLGADGEPQFTVRDQAQFPGQNGAEADFERFQPNISPREGVGLGRRGGQPPIIPCRSRLSTGMLRVSSWASENPTNTIIPSAGGPGRANSGAISKIQVRRGSASSPLCPVSRVQTAPSLSVILPPPFSLPEHPPFI